MHGGGGVIDRHIGLKGSGWPHQVWLDIADEDGVHVLVPQGINEHWNDCRSDCDRCGEEDDLGFLLALLDDLSTRTPIDATRIYASGESNGGFMTQRLAQEAPERFAAMGVVISQLPENSECADAGVPMPMMHQLGTTDAAIQYEGGEGALSVKVRSAADTMAHWRTVNRCEKRPASTRIYADLDPDDQSTVIRTDWACPATGTALSLVKMEGAGHVAPSVVVQVSGLREGIAGIQNHDIEGARVLWEFMREHSRAQ